MSGYQQLGSSIASFFRPVDTRAAAADQAKIELDRRQREANLGESLADQQIKEIQAKALQYENIANSLRGRVPDAEIPAMAMAIQTGRGGDFKAGAEALGQFDENARRNRIETNFDPNNPRGIEGARAALGLALTPQTAIEGGVTYDPQAKPNQPTYLTADAAADNARTPAESAGTWSDYNVTNKDGTTTPYLFNNKTREIVPAVVGRPSPTPAPAPLPETLAQREARVMATANQMVAAGKPDAEIQQFINAELSAPVGQTTDNVNVSLGGSLAPPPRIIDGVSVPAPGFTATPTPGLGGSVNPLTSYPKATAATASVSTRAQDRLDAVREMKQDAINYAAAVIGSTPEKVALLTPQKIRELVAKGGRVMTGPVPTMVPGVNRLVNADLEAYANSAAGKKARINNPSGVVTNADFDVARRSIFSPEKPDSVNADLIYQALIDADKQLSAPRGNAPAPATEARGLENLSNDELMRQINGG